MTAEEVLIGAAELIEKGWCQHQLATKDRTKYCVIGALGVAAGCALIGDVYPTWGALGDREAYTAAEEALEREVGGDVIVWNNARNRTAIEVSTALRNARRHLNPTQEDEG